MKNILSKFNTGYNMPTYELIKLIIELDKIDNGYLSESEDDELSNFYNNLYKTHNKQIDDSLNNTAPSAILISSYVLKNRGETVGDFMRFLKHIDL